MDVTLFRAQIEIMNLGEEWLRTYDDYVRDGLFAGSYDEFLAGQGTTGWGAIFDKSVFDEEGCLPTGGSAFDAGITPDTLVPSSIALEDGQRFEAIVELTGNRNYKVVVLRPVSGDAPGASYVPFRDLKDQGPTPRSRPEVWGVDRIRPGTVKRLKPGLS